MFYKKCHYRRYRYRVEVDDDHLKNSNEVYKQMLMLLVHHLKSIYPCYARDIFNSVLIKKSFIDL